MSDEAEPYHVGRYAVGDSAVPVYLASRLWDARHADRLDTGLRQSRDGLSVVLTTTEKPTRRFLGPGIVVPVHQIITDGEADMRLDLSRVTGELRRWQTAAQATQHPSLIKESAYSAMLVGPWPSPWTLTKSDWINVVEVLVDVWNSGVRKISKVDLERRLAITIRSMRELFKDAPEWQTYIRGADGNAKPRVWELNIGQPEHGSAASSAAVVEAEPTEA